MLAHHETAQDPPNSRQYIAQDAIQQWRWSNLVTAAIPTSDAARDMRHLVCVSHKEVRLSTPTVRLDMGAESSHEARENPPNSSGTDDDGSTILVL
jgi:hypothetical protein